MTEGGVSSFCEQNISARQTTRKSINQALARQRRAIFCLPAVSFPPPPFLPICSQIKKQGVWKRQDSLSFTQLVWHSCHISGGKASCEFWLTAGVAGRSRKTLRMRLLLQASSPSSSWLEQLFLLGLHLLIGADACLISPLALGGIGPDTGEALGRQERKEEER